MPVSQAQVVVLPIGDVMARLLLVIMFARPDVQDGRRCWQGQHLEKDRSSTRRRG